MLWRGSSYDELKHPSQNMPRKNWPFEELWKLGVTIR